MYDFSSVEEEVLSFWEENNIHQKLKEKRSKGKKFFLLDGPPYVTGDPHPGTAFNRCLKDLVRRYKWMKGFNVWDQPGFDMHGLPIESMVEKKLDLKNKSEIVKYGVKKFVSECKSYALKYLNVMSKVFARLGEWADFKHPYRTIDNSYIEGVWWALKKIWDKNALYEGTKVLPWCPHCGTALASNYEVDYKEIKENSIFVKFKVKDGEYLIIWTTTPWTLACNMAVMVNPKISYVKAKFDDEVWIVAKDLVEEFSKIVGKNYKVLKELKGKDLEKLEYETPFAEEVPFLKNTKHFVVLSEEYVNTQEGTGLVHCAPGCGPEDEDVGKKYGLPSFNPIDELGVFGKEGGKFKGYKAKFDDKKFIKLLEEKGLLVAERKITHDYPHCERCKTPIVFRPTKQWFIEVTKFKEKMINENKKVHWVPKWAGENQFHNWLKSIKDWCISRQRFWGVPLPVWICDKCNSKIVIGSIKELEKYSGKKVKDLHKPEIDKFVWKCKCGGTYKRNPDVIDVWIDSACAPFASLPLPREEWMKKLGKVDFIVEAKDQIRGWFYSLMGIGVSAFGECPYKNVFMNGYLCDETGAKLSKRKGNYISMEEIIRKYGADVFRITLMNSLTPGVDSRFIDSEMNSGYKYLNIIWNTYLYIKRNMDFFNVNPNSIVPPKNVEDEWLVSRLNSTIKKIEECMSTYHIEEYVPIILNFFIEDLSRFYIKVIRDKLNKDNVSLMYHTFLTALKLLGPAVPFISEKIYKNLTGKESLFLEDFPSYDVSKINEGLEEDMQLLKQLVTFTLAARDKAKINVRWPLSEVIIYGKKLPSYLEDLFKGLVNVDKITYTDKLPKGVKVEFKLNYEAVKKEFGEDLASKIIPRVLILSKETIVGHLLNEGFITLDVGEEVVVPKSMFIEIQHTPENIVGFNNIYLITSMTEDLLSRGYTRETIRRIQELRKKLGLIKLDKIDVFISCPGKLQKYLMANIGLMKETVGAENILFEYKKGDLEREFKIKEFSVKISIKKLK